MVAVAIFSIDPVLRRNLEQLPRDDPTIVLVGVVDRPRSLWELVDENHVDAVLTDAPTRELLADYRGRHDRTALVARWGGRGGYCSRTQYGRARRARSLGQSP